MSLASNTKSKGRILLIQHPCLLRDNTYLKTHKEQLEVHGVGRPPWKGKHVVLIPVTTERRVARWELLGLTMVPLIFVIYNREAFIFPKFINYETDFEQVSAYSGYFLFRVS